MNRTILLILICGLSASAQKILVPPYLQPGNAPTLSKEQKVVIWQTDSIPGNFRVDFAAGASLEHAKKLSVAKVTSVQLKLLGKTSFLYRATLTGLLFDTEYAYRVSLDAAVISATTFTTRTKKNTTHFVVFGDCGAGTPQQAEIAYRVFQQKPQFVLVTGDNVYNAGLEREYRGRFFPAYTSLEASPQKGAPLMQSVPFYMVVGNHDVQAPNLDKFPDGLAYFYYNDLPTNAPVTELTVKLEGKPELVKAFEKATDGRFPKLANFSFDNGNVHITCLDANPYVNPLDYSLIEWLRRDIGNSKADWKIVAFHHPGFNSSKSHYDYQLMRILAPVLEELGVDMVLNGHVHSYQRSMPLKFAPKKDSAGERYVLTPAGGVDGTFTLDQQFDGVTNTKPKGIIYIVTGAGGAGLYEPGFSGKPELWKHEPRENWVPFTVKLISNVHSYTLIETDGKKLKLRQLDLKDNEIDAIVVTK